MNDAPAVAKPEDAPARTPAILLLAIALMMFLEYFIQGCYQPMVFQYLQRVLHFSADQSGWFQAALTLGTLFAPFVIGQVVDRHIASQKVLAFCHWGGGLTMLALFGLCSNAELAGGSLGLLVILLGATYSLLYVPTMMLTNSITFSHLVNRDQEFPWVRLCGTLGFVAPAFLIEGLWLGGLTNPDEIDRARVISFALAGGAGLVMGCYALSLPNTPPHDKKSGRFAPVVVARLLEMRNFLVLVLVSFPIAIVHSFFFQWNFTFVEWALQRAEFTGAVAQRVTSIGQISEVFVMLLLGFALRRIGYKNTMILGATAYCLRCVLLAMAGSSTVGVPMMLTLTFVGQALHGVCFGCFLAVAYIYVDRVAPPDVRGSMQNLYGNFLLGLGFMVGGVVGGRVGAIFTMRTATGDVHNWPMIWGSCAILAACCAVGFAIFFPSDHSNVDEEKKA